MIVEFFGRGGWFAVALCTDDGKEVFFFGEIIEPVLFEAYQFGIDALLFRFGREFIGQFFRITCLRAVGDRNLADVCGWNLEA